MKQVTITTSIFNLNTMIHIVLKLNSSTYVIKNFELSFIGEALFLLFFIATYLYIFPPIFIILIFSILLTLKLRYLI
ncbi:hypothetical protein HMPREF0772_10893 [Staphylococcus aureus subsp. aureus TCH60]|uniref:Uncharacterized protein n=1 Tax=Staphylococcus aureus subsp. aureus MN8 TaxID=548470 RepID=A0A0E1XE55_STAAU|nr:hypothetical protein HMPREF0772_10893 [Staphylococcus aureus subsp. aureus TCH60]EFH96850.1 hypothetical protein HMPREF0769_10852 [Staphylococcus aureus subsp. aureus MN8]